MGQEEAMIVKRVDKDLEFFVKLNFFRFFKLSTLTLKNCRICFHHFYYLLILILIL